MKIFNVAFTSFFLCINLQAQTTFFVSLKGNDINDGTLARPFASISRAVAEAYKTPGSVKVYLKGVTYYLSQPIVFIPTDSGKENKALMLTNYENQKVTINGSVP